MRRFTALTASIALAGALLLIAGPAEARTKPPTLHSCKAGFYPVLVMSYGNVFRYCKPIPR